MSLQLAWILPVASTKPKKCLRYTLNPSILDLHYKLFIWQSHANEPHPTIPPKRKTVIHITELGYNQSPKPPVALLSGNVISTIHFKNCFIVSKLCYNGDTSKQKKGTKTMNDQEKQTQEFTDGEMVDERAPIVIEADNRNKNYLFEFEDDLTKQNIDKETIHTYVSSIEFYLIQYLTYDGKIISMEDGANTGRIDDFLSEFFLHKCMWASVKTLKEYLVSLDLFYQSMAKHQHISEEDAKQVTDYLTSHKDPLIDRYTNYNDDPESLDHHWELFI